MNPLTAFGLLLQVLGGLVALWGLIKTHDAYAEKPLVLMAKERAARSLDRLIAALRRLLRQPRRQTVEADLAVEGGGAFDAGAVITYPPIATDIPLREAIQLLDARLRQASERLTRVEGTVTELGDATRRELTQLRERVQRDVTTFRELVRHAAVEGLMTEAVGLVMVTIGAVLQGFGSLGSS